LADNKSKKNIKSFRSLKAHKAALISVSLALSQTPVFTLRDHGYRVSVSRGVPVYVTAVKTVPNYTAGWQRHMCVNNLPKVDHSNHYCYLWQSVCNLQWKFWLEILTFL